MNRKDYLVLGAIFIAGLALRLAAVLTLPEQFNSLHADAREYDNLAMNLLSAKGYINSDTGQPTSWRTPVYPIFLAGIYSIFGHDYFYVRLVQALMSALLIIIIFYIGKLIFDKRVGLISAFFLAIYQPYIFYVFFGGPAYILSENLFTFLLAATVFFMIKRLFTAPNIRNHFLAGLLFGSLALTRPIIALFPILFFPVFLFMERKRLKSMIKGAFIFAAAFCLFISPWVIRNYIVQKSFIPFSTEGGFVLYGTNNHLVRGSGLVSLDGLMSAQEKENLANMSEVEQDSYYRKKAMEYLSGNYKRLPKIFLKKLAVLWDVYATDYDRTGNAVRKYNICYSLALMFGLYGIYKSLKLVPSMDRMLLIFLFIYTSLITLLTAGEPRFRYPIEPYLIIFAGFGIICLYNAFKNKIFSCSVISFIFILNIAMYAFSGRILSLARGVLGYLDI